MGGLIVYWWLDHQFCQNVAQICQAFIKGLLIKLFHQRNVEFSIKSKAKRLSFHHTTVYCNIVQYVVLYNTRIQAYKYKSTFSWTDPVIQVCIVSKSTLKANQKLNYSILKNLSILHFRDARDGPWSYGLSNEIKMFLKTCTIKLVLLSLCKPAFLLNCFFVFCCLLWRFLLFSKIYFGALKLWFSAWKTPSK